MPRLLLLALLTLSTLLPCQANSWGFSIGGIGYNSNSNPCQTGGGGGFVGYYAPPIVYAPPPVIYMQPYQNWRAAAYPAYQNYPAYPVYPPMGYRPVLQMGGYYCR